MDNLLVTLTEGCEKGREQMKKRRRCLAERDMYYNEVDKRSVLRGEKYYFIDRLWMTKWFLSLCDGRIAEEKVTNQHLTDEHGHFSHDARPNGSFTGGFSIVSPTLWEYLHNEYGVEGGTFTSGTHFQLIFVLMLLVSLYSLRTSLNPIMQMISTTLYMTSYEMH